MVGLNRFRKEGASAFIRKAVNKMQSFLYSRDTLAFFQWCNTRPNGEDKKSMDEVKLQSLGWATLARAAICHENDTDTISYLVRAGERLFKGEAQGFVMVSGQNVPVHFCWVSGYDGFFVEELQTRLKGDTQDSVIIFDCWTPTTARGHGFYPEAIKRVAQRFSGTGKTSWILSSTKNSSSIRGIEKSGFKKRFLAVSHKILNNKIVLKPNLMEMGNF
jgi:hypothetical protein